MVDYVCAWSIVVGHHLHCLQIIATSLMDHFWGHYQLHSGSGHDQAEVAEKVRGTATRGKGAAVRVV